MSFAQNTPKVSLDVNEGLFAVATAMNVCGYDQELNNSDPLRAQIRAEVGNRVLNSEAAKETVASMCQYYHEHEQNDAGKDVAQYVSLALYLNPPPGLSPKVKEAELPPDASLLLGFLPFLQRFYEQAGLKEVWQRHREAYLGLTDRYHEPLSKMLFDTEIYLKIPSAAYLGRQFTVYLEPMLAPSQTNARNYGSDYFVVMAPAPSLKMAQIRHTYIHYLLDPLALKHGTSLQRLQPLLEAVNSSALEEPFKRDISLLVTECMVRAIEARTLGNRQTPDSERLKIVDDSEKEGFILTRYFYNAFVAFEKDPVGLQNAYSELLRNIDVRQQLKLAQQIQFTQQASPELLRLARRPDDRLLKTAEQKLSAGDPAGAEKYARQALDENREDQGRALFILAQVATANRDIQGARNYFQRAIEVAQEPKVVAWSHIYLGRIFDLQENREAAVTQYRAALSASGSVPEAKAAAERGLQQAYEPPVKRNPEEQPPEPQP